MEHGERRRLEDRDAVTGNGWWTCQDLHLDLILIRHILGMRSGWQRE
jgi:hypothetical protein